MVNYLAFGRRLRSDVPFPELTRDVDGPADWTLETVAGAATPPNDAQLIGRDDVQQGVHVRLFAAPSAYWLQFDDTGCFEVSRDGAQIRWHAPSPDLVDIARVDVLGRVLATALHAQGMLCLHGSGVCIGDQAIAFLAPKFHGKSTTALALVRGGARLITDDTLVVAPQEPVMALPGIHAMRLWADTARRLGDESEDGAPDAEKRCLTDLPDAQRMQQPERLAAIYLLSPVKPAPERAAVYRRPLDPMRAALSLVGHGKLTALFGGDHGARSLQRAVDVARSVPVYTLMITRDFDRLDEVVNRIGEWHGGLGAEAATARGRA